MRDLPRAPQIVAEPNLEGASSNSKSGAVAYTSNKPNLCICISEWKDTWNWKMHHCKEKECKQCHLNMRIELCAEQLTCNVSWAFFLGYCTSGVQKKKHVWANKGNKTGLILPMRNLLHSIFWALPRGPSLLSHGDTIYGLHLVISQNITCRSKGEKVPPTVCRFTPRKI